MQTYAMSVLDVRSKDSNSEYVGVLVGCKLEGVLHTASFPYKREDAELLRTTKNGELGTIVMVEGGLDKKQPANGGYVSIAATCVTDAITDRVLWKASVVANAMDMNSILKSIQAQKVALKA